MDDKELIRKVAEKVMGWVWVDEYHAWIVDSERDADGRLTNCFPDGLDILHDSFGEYVGQEPFDLTNANHWMMVVEAMRKRGYHFDISDNCVSFWKEEVCQGFRKCWCGTTNENKPSYR